MSTLALLCSVSFFRAAWNPPSEWHPKPIVFQQIPWSDRRRPFDHLGVVAEGTTGNLDASPLFARYGRRVPRMAEGAGGRRSLTAPAAPRRCRVTHGAAPPTLARPGNRCPPGLPPSGAGTGQRSPGLPLTADDVTNCIFCTSISICIVQSKMTELHIFSPTHPKC